jgi:hypothetical protein
MDSVISRMSSTDLAFFGFFCLVCLTGIIALLATLWYKHRRLEIETALKQDMLNRGMSAEEIERVMRASASKDCETLHKTSVP